MPRSSTRSKQPVLTVRQRRRKAMPKSRVVLLHPDALADLDALVRTAVREEIGKLLAAAEARGLD